MLIDDDRNRSKMGVKILKYWEFLVFLVFQASLCHKIDHEVLYHLHRGDFCTLIGLPKKAT